MADRANEVKSAATFHKQVFAKYGDVCVFCGTRGSSDAAHVVSRPKLGKYRYADPRLARPAHRACHQAQHRGEVTFPRAVVIDAIRAHNELPTKVKLMEPE